MRLLRPLRGLAMTAAVFLIALSITAGAEGKPKRIVSLAPSITENLCYLGLEEKLIAVTSYCNYSSEVEKKEIIGSLTNPNAEKIFSLSPDLVVALNRINRPQTIEKLKSLGLRVAVLESGNSFDGIAKSFIRLGKLTDKEKKAEEIVSETKKELAIISGKIRDLPPVRVFWEVGSKPLVSAGGGAFANEFIRRSGGANIFRDTSIRYPRVSREEVLKRNPEVIILVTMGNVTEGEKAYWQKFKDMDAVKNNRIYTIDADKVCRPTPVSFLATVKKVAALLHPETFREEWGFE